MSRGASRLFVFRFSCFGFMLIGCGFLILFLRSMNVSIFHATSLWVLVSYLDLLT